MIRLENDLISLLQSGDYWQYNYPALMRQGFTEENAILMSKHGIPHHFLGFEFYDIGDFKTHEVSNETYIQIGIFKPHPYTSQAIYIYSGNGRVIKEAEHHLALLNRDLRTFFLFQVIFIQVAKQYNLKSVEECNAYGTEVRAIFEEIDPEAMQNSEGYWSTKVEEYEEMW